MTNWYQQTPEEVCAVLDSSPNGLTASQVVAHRARFGDGKVKKVGTPNPLLTFFRQFASPFVFLLLAAAAFSAVTGDWKDVATILSIVCLNSLLGTYFEIRTAYLSLHLRDRLNKTALVRRDGKVIPIPATTLTVGDIVLLQAGQQVPADCRIIQNDFLRIDESILTGENLPVAKQVAALAYVTPTAEQLCMAFQGTFVTAGRGEAIVVAVGTGTVLGAIENIANESRGPESPLILRIRSLNRVVAYVSIAFASLLFFYLATQGEGTIEAFRTATAVMVAAVPEGLPIIITLTLLLGIHYLAEEKALVKNLAAVDTMAEVNVLLTDKTGTITENRLTVRQLLLPRPEGVARSLLQTTDPFTPGLSHLLKAAVLANEATQQPNLTDLHDPLERALILAAEHLRVDTVGALQKQRPLTILPFTSEHKLMAGYYQHDVHQVIAYVKGAPEVIIARCTTMELHGQRLPFNAELKEQVFAALEAESKLGHKGLAFAYLTMPRTSFDESRARTRLSSLDEQAERLQELVFLGALSLEDPLRPDIAKVAKELEKEGITIKIASGDHQSTTAAIAQAINLKPQFLSAEALPKASARELTKQNVFARVDPATKLRIVQALQKQGKIVAMAGDGVNDAPALKQANIGIALGKAGNDLSRDAADIVLLDDSLATILTAIRSGRVLTQNIQLIILFLFTTNLVEVLTVLLGSLVTGGTSPLLPSQILWINLLSDTPLALPLAFERTAALLHTKSPHKPHGSLYFAPAFLRLALTQALATLILSLGTFFMAYQAGLPDAALQTLVFYAVVLGQIWTLIAFHRPTVPFALVHPSHNPVLRRTIGGVTLFLIATAFLPPLRSFANLALVPGSWLIGLFLVSWIVPLSADIVKLATRNPNKTP